MVQLGESASKTTRCAAESVSVVSAGKSSTEGES